MVVVHTAILAVPIVVMYKFALLLYLPCSQDLGKKALSRIQKSVEENSSLASICTICSYVIILTLNAVMLLIFFTSQLSQ